MELVYAKGQLKSDGTQVGLWEPQTDRLEEIAWLSPYIGQHNNAANHAIDFANVAIGQNLTFEKVLEGARRVYAIWLD